MTSVLTLGSLRTAVKSISNLLWFADRVRGPPASLKGHRFIIACMFPRDHIVTPCRPIQRNFCVSNRPTKNLAFSRPYEPEDARPKGYGMTNQTNSRSHFDRTPQAKRIGFSTPIKATREIQKARQSPAIDHAILGRCPQATQAIEWERLVRSAALGLPRRVFPLTLLNSLVLDCAELAWTPQRPRPII